jgi:hypothetical protein
LFESTVNPPPNQNPNGMKLMIQTYRDIIPNEMKKSNKINVEMTLSDNSNYDYLYIWMGLRF